MKARRKGKAPQICYACNSPGTTREHVPPRGIFPKEKDYPDVGDQRRGLITVPSCPEHNSSKSKDDEYIAAVLAMTLQASKVGFGHFQTKVIRAFQQSQGLTRAALSNIRPVYVRDGCNLVVTGAADLDHARVRNAFEMMSRGIYYHHFEERFVGSIKVAEGFSLSVGHADSETENARTDLLLREYGQLLSTFETHGDNPAVFYYQAIKIENLPVIIRMVFYSHVQVFAVLHPAGCEPIADQPTFR